MGPVAYSGVPKVKKGATCRLHTLLPLTCICPHTRLHRSAAPLALQRDQQQHVPPGGSAVAAGAAGAGGAAGAAVTGDHGGAGGLRWLPACTCWLQWGEPADVDWQLTVAWT
jgi:hypothetical protein